MLKIYHYRELVVSQKPTGDLENNINSYLEALEALKTTLISVKTKKKYPELTNDGFRPL